MHKKELQKKIDETKEFIRSDAPQAEKDKKIEETRSLVANFKNENELDGFDSDLNEKKFPAKRSKVEEPKEDPNQEMRSMVNEYLHSKGSTRSDKLMFTSDNDVIIPAPLTRANDGVKSEDVNVTIPKSIVYNPQDEVKTVVDLAKFVNHVAVKTAEGSYPIRKKATAKMNTVAELEQNPALAKPSFLNVSYKVETRRAAEPVSQESIDDSAIDLIPMLTNDANEQKINTTNFDTATVLKSFTAVTIKTLDDIKKINNTELDQAYNRSLVVTGSFYQWLDTLKDGNGRYLLQDDIQSASGKSLLSMPVFKIDDELFGEKGEAHAWIGDLKRGVFYADRAQITARWADYDIYGQFLQIGTRYDIVKADENAGYFLSLDTKATSNDTSTVTTPDAGK